MDGSADREEYEKAGGETKLMLPHLLKVSTRVLPLPTSNDFAHGNHEFIHILAGVVEGEGGTDAHFVAEGTEGGLSAVVTGTHRDALLI